MKLRIGDIVEDRDGNTGEIAKLYGKPGVPPIVQIKLTSAPIPNVYLWAKFDDLKKKRGAKA
jgi:hypothetical protein